MSHKKPFEEDQMYIGDDDAPLSSQMTFFRSPSGKIIQKTEGMMAFDKLIKQNPFETDIKLTEWIQTFKAPVRELNFEPKIIPPSAQINPKELKAGAETFPTAMSGTLPDYDSKDIEESKNLKKQNVAGANKKNNGNNINQIMIVETDCKEKTNNSYSIPSAPSERQFRTYPFGILKMGEKSKFSRDFDDSPTASKDMTDSARWGTPSKDKNIKQQSNFSNSKKKK